MSQPELDFFFVNIVAPARMQSPFRCLAELADRAFILADARDDADAVDVPLGLRARYARIVYPVGSPDVEPSPTRAVLYQSTPAMKVIINFQTKTAECEGQPDLPIGPERIEYAQEEIKPYLQDVHRRWWARKEARRIQENLAWTDFLERLKTLPEWCPRPDDPSATRRYCPLCDGLTSPCLSCNIIMCSNTGCVAFRLMASRWCSFHVFTGVCLPCLENAKGVPLLGECPECRLWACQFELTWCLGRPKDSLNRPPNPHFRRLSNSEREHPPRPVRCSCVSGIDPPRCANEKCWSRVVEHTSVCESCSPGGGLWCTCKWRWLCDDCKASPTENCFKECPLCRRVYCVEGCDYIQFCAECGQTTPCDDCAEEDWDNLAVEGVVLEGECQASDCMGRICGACLERAQCTGCSKVYCSSCVALQRCSGCDGRFCVACHPMRTRRCSGCDASREA